MHSNARSNISLNNIVILRFSHEPDVVGWRELSEFMREFQFCYDVAKYDLSSTYNEDINSENCNTTLSKDLSRTKDYVDSVYHHSLKILQQSGDPSIDKYNVRHKFGALMRSQYRHDLMKVNNVTKSADLLIGAINYDQHLSITTTGTLQPMIIAAKLSNGMLKFKDNGTILVEMPGIIECISNLKLNITPIFDIEKTFNQDAKDL